MREVRAAMPASTVSGVEIAILGAVVLAERDDVDAELVGEHRLLDDLADRLRRGRRGAPSSSVGHVAEGVEAEHEVGHGLLLDVRRT